MIFCTPLQFFVCSPCLIKVSQVSLLAQEISIDADDVAVLHITIFYISSVGMAQKRKKYIQVLCRRGTSMNKGISCFKRTLFVLISITWVYSLYVFPYRAVSGGGTAPLISAFVHLCAARRLDLRPAREYARAAKFTRKTSRGVGFHSFTFQFDK